MSETTDSRPSNDWFEIATRPSTTTYSSCALVAFAEQDVAPPQLEPARRSCERLELAVVEGVEQLDAAQQLWSCTRGNLVTHLSPPSVPAVGSVWAIVVAAGSGSRFGGPKQYEQLGDRRVLDWSLDGARVASDGIVLVVPPAPSDRSRARGDHRRRRRDATRSGSVRAGLAAVPADVPR